MTLEAGPILERIYPKKMDADNVNDRDSIEIHESRYRFASANLHGSRVLDLACGCGFGTALMALQHPQIEFFGVDIDPRAIAYAQEHYSLNNLSFVCENAMSFSGQGFDAIVSLETIEHLPQPAALIARMTSMLNKAGKIIASVPVTPTCDGNPHHLHDFSRRSFFRLFSVCGHYPGAELSQVQKWVYDEAFSNSEKKTSRSHGVGNNVLAYYRRRPWALVTRVYSLLRHGACNIYLTAVFTKPA